MKAPRIAYKGHRLAVVALTVIRVDDSKDSWILSGSEDKSLRVWSLSTGEAICTLKVGQPSLYVYTHL
jgi:WD40 repeat protein